MYQNIHEPTIEELRRICQRNLANQVARARIIMGDPIRGVIVGPDGKARIV